MTPWTGPDQTTRGELLVSCLGPHSSCTQCLTRRQRCRECNKLRSHRLQDTTSQGSTARSMSWCGVVWRAALESQAHSGRAGVSLASQGVHPMSLARRPVDLVQGLAAGPRWPIGCQTPLNRRLLRELQKTLPSFLLSFLPDIFADLIMMRGQSAQAAICGVSTTRVNLFNCP